MYGFHALLRAATSASRVSILVNASLRASTRTGVTPSESTDLAYQPPTGGVITLLGCKLSSLSNTLIPVSSTIKSGIILSTS